MATQKFVPQHFHNSIGAYPPVLTVASGDTIIAETADAHGFDRHGNKMGENPNPMTGPFFVSGAEPGDALQVSIKRISMTRASGWTRAGLAPNVVDPARVPVMPVREKTDWVIDTAANSVRLKEPSRGLQEWSVPIEPMIGCFGVAPDGGQAISTATSGPYGGNMDYRGFRPGCSVLFPVSQPGALFFLGDVHACQGDGEIAGTGIETAAEVEVTLTVLKGRRIGWPRGETESEIFTVGNARPLDQALQHATTEMVDWLCSDFGLTLAEAGVVLGMAVRYDIANVFNPAYSVACRLEKFALPG